MYSRSLGVMNNSENGVEKFNQNLRHQYSQKRKTLTPVLQETGAKKEESTPQASEKGSALNFIENLQSGISNLNLNIDFETVLIIGLILLMLTDTDVPDLVLLGILVSLIL